MKITWGKHRGETNTQFGYVHGTGFGKFFTIAWTNFDIGGAPLAQHKVWWLIHHDSDRSKIVSRVGAKSIMEAKRKCLTCVCPNSIEFILDLEKENVCENT